MMEPFVLGWFFVPAVLSNTHTYMRLALRYRNRESACTYCACEAILVFTFPSAYYMHQRGRDVVNIVPHAPAHLLLQPLTKGPSNKRWKAGPGGINLPHYLSAALLGCANFWPSQSGTLIPVAAMDEHLRDLTVS